MTRYLLIEVSLGDVDVVRQLASQDVRVVAEGSAVQVLLAAWEDVVPIELMSQLRLTDLPAAQRRKAERLRAAEPAATN